jgi:hypothetical protein
MIWNNLCVVEGKNRECNWRYLLGETTADENWQVHYLQLMQQYASHEKVLLYHCAVVSVLAGREGSTEIYGHSFPRVQWYFGSWAVLISGFFWWEALS